MNTSAGKSGSEYRISFLLLARLGRGPLALTLSIDTSSERVLKSQSNNVHNQHKKRQGNTGGLSVRKRSAQKAHRRAPVHRRRRHVEGKARHHLVHEDAAVVAQEGSRNAQPPCRGDDEDHATGEERVSDNLRQQRRQQRMRRLVLQGCLVQRIADEAEREDGDGERIAGDVAVASR